MKWALSGWILEEVLLLFIHIIFRSNYTFENIMWSLNYYQCWILLFLNIWTTSLCIFYVNIGFYKSDKILETISAGLYFSYSIKQTFQQTSLDVHKFFQFPPNGNVLDVPKNDIWYMDQRFQCRYVNICFLQQPNFWFL